MVLEQKVEAVNKISAVMDKQSQIASTQPELERVAPNRELFDNLMKGPDLVAQQGSHRTDVHVEPVDKNPIFTDENLSSQKNGSATDQERKQKQHQEVDEIDAVKEKKSKGKSDGDVPLSFLDEVKSLNSRVTSVSRMNSEQLKNQSQGIITQLENIKTQLSGEHTEINSAYQTVLQNRLTHIDDNLRIALSKAGVEYTPPVQDSAGPHNPIEKFLGYLTHSQYQLTHLDQTIQQLSFEGKDLSPANMLALQLKMSYISQQVELFTALMNKALESTKTIMNVQI